jgi:facilitated trehalose transporter
MFHQKINIPGALFPWRWALGITIFAPCVCFSMLLFCPETPVWLLSEGRQEEAWRSLEWLRGKHNRDVIEMEFNRIQDNIEIQRKEEDFKNGDDKPSVLKKVFNLLTDMSFMKPFAFLLVIFAIAMEWTGLNAIGFYMVPLLK